jgi:glycerol-3-phosphate dehydrogenase (NAD(P)+)
MSMVAEGVRTSTSVQALADKHGVEMPICDAVYSVLNKGLDPKDAVSRLMMRDLGSEEFHP